MPEQYAVLVHDRWLESEKPEATVIRSVNGRTWHPVCVAYPETAHEIADTMNAASMTDD